MDASQTPPQLSAEDGLDRGFSNWFNALPNVREAPGIGSCLQLRRLSHAVRFSLLRAGSTGDQVLRQEGRREVESCSLCARSMEVSEIDAVGSTGLLQRTRGKCSVCSPDLLQVPGGHQEQRHRPAKCALHDTSGVKPIESATAGADRMLCRRDPQQEPVRNSAAPPAGGQCGVHGAAL